MPGLPSWTPDLASLDLLLSTAELGSVGKAAAAHGISQPSASARLGRLERQLGIALLVRGTRGTTLTPAGEAVVAWAAAVVNSAHALTDGVQILRKNAVARLRVAASLTVAEYLMPPWISGLRQAHPDAEVVATVANSRLVCDAVRDGAADVGFIETPDVPAAFSSLRVGRDRLALVTSPSLAKTLPRPSISPLELTRLPLLLREQGSGTRETFIQALTETLGHDPTLTHAFELGSTTTILATARAGGGIGVVSARAVAAEVSSGVLVQIRITGLDPQRPLTAVWLGRRPTALAGELISLAQKRT